MPRIAAPWSAAWLVVAALLQTSDAVGASATSTAAEPTSVPASAALSLTDAVVRIVASERLQRATLSRLIQPEAQREFGLRIEALQAELDRLTVNLAAPAELADLVDLDHRARAVEGSSTGVVEDLTAKLRRLEHDLGTVVADLRGWQERGKLIADERVPAEVATQARAVEAALGSVADQMREVRDSVLRDFVRAITLQARSDEAAAGITARLEQVRLQRIDMERAPLWQLGATSFPAQGVAASLHAYQRVLTGYLADHGARLAGWFFAILALSWSLFAWGGVPAAGHVQRACARPAAACTLISLMAMGWIAVSPPVAFYELLLALLPVPAAILVNRAFGRTITPTLVGLALSTVLLALRNVIEASALTDRLLLLLQTVSLAVPVAVDLRRGALQRAFPRLRPGTVRAAALVVIAASAVTALNVFIGFTGPARSLRTGAGSLLGFGLVFGATALALYGAVLALLATPLLHWLRSARTADPALLRSLRWILGLAALGGVSFVTLGNLRLTAEVRAATDALLDTGFDVGALSISVRALAASASVALATVVMTGLTGFILEREVFPRLSLRPGAGYAIATFVRWVMIIIGTVLALVALGLDLSKITLIAGALGVGVGFGLQGVVNNFVSGLILIVERPVSVGDVIEIGALSGEIKRIGIRSSSVRTALGAEVVVPNAELTSKEVINWTRSDRQRRYDIDVAVAYGADPEQVMRVLVEAAAQVPEVMRHPLPVAVFKGFGQNTLDFKLQAWVDRLELGLQAQNALRVVILRRLDDAGILMPVEPGDGRTRAANARAP